MQIFNITPMGKPDKPAPTSGNSEMSYFATGRSVMRSA
ncbi:Uncharacterised protein [Raoultella ornithinolytica]|nr:Uncharacterised protein [Raoultella ornithinolytica]